MTMYILQLCHDYKAPFLSVAKQYASLFEGTQYKVVTVFLKGEYSEDVVAKSGADEVVFLDNTTLSLRGLKLKQIRQIKHLHEQYKFTFCIAQRYKALYISSHLKNILTVGVLHIDGVFGKYFRRRYVIKNKEKIVLLGVSKAIRDDIRIALPGFPKERILYSYNSLNFDAIRSVQFERDEAREKLNLSEESFVFANVGRLHPDKDQKTLINAFLLVVEKMENAQLLIAGEGELRGELESQIKSLGLEGRVILLGMIQDVVLYLKAFDVFVLSSIREGLPVALLEAFSADLPCIASRCTGNEEAIRDVGYDFSVGDVVRLSELMLETFFLSEEKKEEIKKNMRKKINNEFAEDAVRTNFWRLPTIKNFFDN